MKTNPSLKIFKLATLALVIALGLFVGSAQAFPVPYVVTLQQVGSNVVATGSGAIDLTGLTFLIRIGSSSAGIEPANDDIETGTPGVGLDAYHGVSSGPTNFGSGTGAGANSSSGDPVGINGSLQSRNLFVPLGYVSGTALSDSSTYDSATFSSLGVTPGTYVWTWGTGPDQKFTLKIGTAAVPDSGSTFGLLFFAVTALFGANRLRLFV